MKSEDRGDAARQRLIEAGLEIFGLYGFEGASTRMLAKKAEVNLAAIPYYFGGKEGMYHAVVRHIVDSVSESMLPVVNKIKERLDDKGISREESLAMLRRLLRAFSGLVVGSQKAKQYGMIIIREQMQPTAAFEILYEGIIRSVHETCALLVGRISGQSEDDANTVIRTHTILGLILAFGAARETILRRLGWKSFDQERADLIGRIVAEQVGILLTQSGKSSGDATDKEGS